MNDYPAHPPVEYLCPPPFEAAHPPDWDQHGWLRITISGTTNTVNSVARQIEKRRSWSFHKRHQVAQILSVQLRGPDSISNYEWNKVVGLAKMANVTFRAEQVPPHCYSQ